MLMMVVIIIIYLTLCYFLYLLPLRCVCWLSRSLSYVCCVLVYSWYNSVTEICINSYIIDGNQHLSVISTESFVRDVTTDSLIIINYTAKILVRRIQSYAVYFTGGAIMRYYLEGMSMTVLLSVLHFYKPLVSGLQSETFHILMSFTLRSTVTTFLLVTASYPKIQSSRQYNCQ
jgi:hypothetical protein